MTPLADGAEEARTALLRRNGFLTFRSENEILTDIMPFLKSSKRNTAELRRGSVRTALPVLFDNAKSDQETHSAVLF